MRVPPYTDTRPVVTGPWSTWRGASCLPDRCFCEAARSSIMRQPSNTISSLAFVWLALVVWHGARRMPAASSRAATWRFVGATALVGVGSAFFHASLTFWGQTADVLGMYLVATLLLLESVARRHTVRASTLNAYFIGGNAALLVALVALPTLRRYAFAAIVLAIIWSEWRRRRTATPDGSQRLFMGAVAVLASAFGVWTLDITRVLCSPTSLWQGHALWHVGGAISTWLAYRAVMGSPTRDDEAGGAAIATGPTC
jgi:hypothetical protein